MIRKMWMSVFLLLPLTALAYICWHVWQLLPLAWGWKTLTVLLMVGAFMLLFGVNFSCYYLILLRQVRNVFRDEEFRLYWGIVIVSTFLIAWNLRGVATALGYTSFGETLRHSALK